MSPPPRLTFAIPFLRSFTYLRAALASVVAQRNPSWRCLMLDEGVEPGAAALIAELGDARIEHRLNERRLGIVGNWNRGLDAAQTEFVTLLHADDQLEPDYLDVMLALADAHPRAIAVACDAEIVDDAGRPVFSLPDFVKRRLLPAGEPWLLRGEPGVAALARGDFVMCPTVAWRRPVLGARRFEEGWKQVPDLELLARLLLDGEEIAGTRRRAYRYRRHAESATAVQTADLSRFEEEIAVLDRIATRARAQGFEHAARVAESKSMVRLHLAFRAVSDLARLRPGAALAKLRLLMRVRHLPEKREQP